MIPHNPLGLRDTSHEEGGGTRRGRRHAGQAEAGEPGPLQVREDAERNDLIFLFFKLLRRFRRFHLLSLRWNLLNTDIHRKRHFFIFE